MSSLANNTINSKDWKKNDINTKDGKMNVINNKDGKKNVNNNKDGKKNVNNNKDVKMNVNNNKDGKKSEEGWIDSNLRRIYVGSIPFGMSSKAVFEFFTKFGPVEFAKVHWGKNGNYCFAFVTFESRESYKAALEAGEAALTLMGGIKLKVGVARKISPEPRGWGWTYVRSRRFAQPRDWKEEEGASAGYLGSSGDQSGDEVGQSQLLPPSELQYNQLGPQAGMSPLVSPHLSHSQYLPFNTSTEQQMIYNNYLADQQVFNPLANNNNNYLSNQHMFNPVVYPYYYPIAGMVFPQYQHQFPQHEVENSGNF